MTLLVIGYGNPLRSDDGAGWHAAQVLAGEPKDRSVEVVATHQLTPELAEPIARASAVIFIDACWDRVPGRIACRKVEPRRTETGAMTHHVLPSTLLAGAEILYGRCPPAVIVSIAGERFDHGEQLSPRVAAALPDLLERVRGWMGRLRERQREESIHA